MRRVRTGQYPATHPSGFPAFPFPTGYACNLFSMPVPDSDSQPERQAAAAAALLAAVSPLADELGELFAAAGHELALVGGAVRDVFLGAGRATSTSPPTRRPSASWQIIGDWADQVWTIGIDFGTVGLRKGGTTFEITTYRSESYDRTSRKPDVSYGPLAGGRPGPARLHGECDGRPAARATSWSTRSAGWLTSGAECCGRPGAPEDSFTDDPLRILRAARFTAQLGFTVAPEVRAAMTELAGLLAPPKVSAERIEGELTKLLLSPLPGGPAAGIRLLVETGVADQVLPEIPRLRLETDEHIRHKDVYEHSLTVLSQAIELEARYGLAPDIVLRLAALLHDIGKPRTRSLLPGGRVAFHHHEVVGAKMASKRLAQLRYRKDIVADVSRLIELHLRFHGYGDGEWTDSAVRRYVTDAGPLLTRLHALTRADCTTRNRAKAQRLAAAYDGLEARIAELAAQEELDRIRPDLDGNEIMDDPRHPAGARWSAGRPSTCWSCGWRRARWGANAAVQELLRWAAAEGLNVPPSVRNMRPSPAE